MKKCIKFYLTASLVLLISFTYFINSFAVTNIIDGIVSYLEWQDCVTDVFIQNTYQSENGISFASIKTRRIDEYTLMLAYCCTDSTETGYIDDCSVRLSISGVGTYDFNVDHGTTYKENNLLKIDWETTNQNNNFFIEMRLVFKTGIADNLFFYTFIKDANSNLSKRFRVTNIARKQIETTTAQETTIATTKQETENTTKELNTKFYVEPETTSAVETKTVKSSATTDEETQGNDAYIENSKNTVVRAKVLKIVGISIAVLLIIGAALILISAGKTKKSDDE